MHAHPVNIMDRMYVHLHIVNKTGPHTADVHGLTHLGLIAPNNRHGTVVSMVKFSLIQLFIVLPPLVPTATVVPLIIQHAPFH